jgi:hypothetical protein
MERFWSKVDIGAPNECWGWKATRTPYGYGNFRIGSATDGTRRKEMSHRMAFYLTHGVWPEKGKVVMHTCDNPPCCNPAHLVLGSYSANNHDAYAKKRRISHLGKGEKSYRAKLNEAQVKEIREIGYKETAMALGAKYGVSRQAVDAVRRNVNWAT